MAEVKVEKAPRWLWNLLILAVILLIGIGLITNFWPEIKGGAKKLGVLSLEGGGKNEGGEKKISIALSGSENFSEIFIPPRGCKFSFQGPADAISRSEADGQIRNIHAHYGRDEKWARGFRFAGPTGESVTITVTPVR